MKQLALALTLAVPLGAFADVGPRPAACDIAGKGCTTCQYGFSESGGDCIGGAIDAGLVLAACNDSSASLTREYYCPKGTTINREGCGCSSLFDLAPLAGVLLLAIRRRAR